jgi:hypothetical protein
MSEIAELCGGADTGRPLVPGSLRGYRTWWRAGWRASVPDGMLPLTSVTRRHVVWTSTLSARCVPRDCAGSGPGSAALPDDHAAPRAGCNCGIYAWYAPDDAGILSASVFGVIEASGRVLMGERGFRAERARITAVVTRNRRVAAACTRAGIAVYRHRRDLLRDHPPDDLSSLLGERPSCNAGRWWARLLDGVDQTCWLAVWGIPPYAPPTARFDPWSPRSRPPH